MINNLVYFWLIISLLFLVFEMSSPGLFYFLAFALGAGITAVVAYFDYTLYVQCLLFLISTIIMLLILKKWVAVKLQKYQPHQRTNIDALRGKKAFVCKAITSHSAGEVKLDGQMWLARTTHEGEIAVGTYVEVKEVRGAHVVVVPILLK